jgi:hypothetical protein
MACINLQISNFNPSQRAEFSAGGAETVKIPYSEKLLSLSWNLMV